MHVYEDSDEVLDLHHGNSLYLTLYINIISLDMTLLANLKMLGGKKKKKKKKNFQKPKRIPHKHKKVKMAVLKYFNVDSSGKVSKIKK